MLFEILNTSGEVVNTIVADHAFVKDAFPGMWRELPEPVAVGARRLSKLDFIKLFTDDEFVNILTTAKVSVAVEAWVKKLEMTTSDMDGTAIDLDDHRTIAGVQSLESSGLIAPGRAAEILRGV